MSGSRKIETAALILIEPRNATPAVKGDDGQKEIRTMASTPVVIEYGRDEVFTQKIAKGSSIKKLQKLLGRLLNPSLAVKHKHISTFKMLYK